MTVKAIDVINKEKVIKGLECCLIYGDGCNKCTDCPYLQEVDCIRKIKRDALTLLEEQKAVDPGVEAFYTDAKDAINAFCTNAERR